MMVEISYEISIYHFLSSWTIFYFPINQFRKNMKELHCWL